jgi:hypothetical protein
MKTATLQKAGLSLAGIIIAAALFFSPGVKIPGLDSAADTYFNNAITKAGLAYATCRVVNASVSIIKESSLQLEPAGVGISLAVGQAVDPIDDMTERLSDVLVTAITSLGVQKLAYEIGVSLAPRVLAAFLVIVSILVWFENERLQSFQRTILRLAVIVLIARFCLPVSSLANAYLDQTFFADQIEAAGNELALGTTEMDKLKDFSLPQIDGMLQTIENSAVFIKRKSVEFKNALVEIVSNMGAIIENLIKLTFLYVGIFLIQVIFLPLLAFWFLAKITNALFQADIPSILKHPQTSKTTTA